MRQQTLKALMTLPALMFAVACQDSPTHPNFADEAVLADAAPGLVLNTDAGKTALVWKSPTKAARTEARTIGRKGGELAIADNGLTLTVPAYALDGASYLSMTAEAGEDVSIQFGPHGTKFNKRVQVAIELSKLEVGDELLKQFSNVERNSAGLVPIGSISAVYFLERDGETVTTIEEIPAFILDGEYLVFFTDHFSGYALAA